MKIKGILATLQSHDLKMQDVDSLSESQSLEGIHSLTHCSAITIQSKF
jgi:hypothetical protein